MQPIIRWARTAALHCRFKLVVVFASAGLLQGALVLATKPAYAQTTEARCNSASVFEINMAAHTLAGVAGRWTPG